MRSIFNFSFLLLLTNQYTWLGARLQNCQDLLRRQDERRGQKLRGKTGMRGKTGGVRGKNIEWCER